MKYHWSGKTATVQDAKEDAALWEGWAETPAAFDPFRGERPPRSADDDPTRWVDQWPIDGLTPDQRRKIKAKLLRADAIFEQASDKETGMIEAMRRAFNGIAQVLFSARLLTKRMLHHEIPELVWDSAISARWWRRADVSQSNLFPYRASHHWIHVDNPADRDSIFRVDVRKWTAALLDLPNAEDNSPDAARETRQSDEQPHLSAIPLEAISENAFTSEQERIKAIEKYKQCYQCSEAVLGVCYSCPCPSH